MAATEPTIDRDSFGRVIAVESLKGGVGKTTITANIGGYLALSGARVLLVDLDPQGNLEDDLGYADDERNDAADRGVCYAGAYSADVILHNRPQTSSFTMSPGDLDEAIQALLMVGGSDGFDLIRAYRKGALDGPKDCSGAKVS